MPDPIIVLPPEERSPEVTREMLRLILWELKKLSPRPYSKLIRDAEDVLWGWKLPASWTAYQRHQTKETAHVSP